MVIPIAKFADLHDKIKQLEAENARLKAEVERLIFDPLTYLDDKGEWMPRHTHLAAVERLKAEVEELTLENSQYEEHHKYGQNVITSLREDVKRLTKAGDAMAYNAHKLGVDAWLTMAKSVVEWENPKGVQS
jgi:cell division protein FtsB